MVSAAHPLELSPLLRPADLCVSTPDPRALVSPSSLTLPTHLRAAARSEPW